MLNPVQLVQMMRNPQQLYSVMMNNPQVKNNPMMNNAMQMYQKGDKEGLNKLMNNLAKQRGTTVEEMRKNLGI